MTSSIKINVSVYSETIHRYLKFILAANVLFFTEILSAQSIPLIQNAYNRNIINLNGEWKAIVDPYESGYYNYRYEPSNDGYFKNKKVQTPQDLIEYNFDESSSLQVPSDWNSQRTDLFFYEGTVWYKKSFNYKPKNGKRLFIYCGAANYHAIVYVNGEKIGEHVGGFTPFNFEITKNIRDENNFIVIKVDNKRNREGVPALNTDWWNYGGLTRDVFLIETNETFIQDYSIQLNKNNPKQLLGWIKLSDSKPLQKISVKIPHAKFFISGVSDKDGNFSFTKDVNLKLWEPEKPFCYQVNIKTESDSIIDTIGFRTVQTSGQNIFLNEKSIFMRGISIHEEAPYRSGRANSKKDARTLLMWAKELGCNYVRLAHYPHNENMLRMADELGLLVWSEIPVYWTIDWKNERTLNNAQNQLTEMIVRDKNRASIIIWSVANETPLTEQRNQFLTTLISHAKNIDSSRLISAALERHYSDSITQVIDDPLGKYLDVLGCNEYIGWYEDVPKKARSVIWNIAYDKPLIVSEFGGDALYSLHGDSLSRWTEEYQEHIYKEQLLMLSRTKQLRGISPWILMDFRSPRRPLPKIQDYYNRKGLISNHGEKKKAFWILQNYYETLKNSWGKN